jgi:hypothetical protein
VNITHAQWLIANQSVVNLDANTPVFVSAKGWPQCVANNGTTCTNTSPATCVEVWNAVMENPPVACVTVTPTNNCQYVASPGTVGTGAACVFTLQGLTGNNTITYDYTNTGSVTVP